MKAIWLVPVIASILILGILGLSTQSHAVINDNVIVGAGGLTLDNETINGNVEVNGGNIDCTDVVINGNVSAENCVGESTIEGGSITGNITLEACNDITVNNVIINGNVEVNDSDDVVFSANTVDGNITVENATGCNVFDNDVDGNIEIGECSTEPPVNNPPTIGSVSITNDVENSVRVCTANDVNDVDGDDVTLSYKWTLIDGFVVGGDENTLPFSAFIFGNTITCEVTPFDGTDFGEPVSFTFVCIGCGF